MSANWPFVAAITKAPRRVDRALARRRLADLLGDREAIRVGLSEVVNAPAARDLLLGVADHSSFLWDLASRDPARLARIFARTPGQALADCLWAASRASETSETEAEVMRALRLARAEAALIIALADIGGAWGVDEVTEAVTQFADMATQAALRFLLRAFAREGRLAIYDIADPERACGLVVLALGKHGARELNYSSDIDLIVFFDPESAAIPEGRVPSIEYVRMTRALARLLQERTEDGYVVRVDLRLRPDPGSTAVAISLPAALGYYETLGQNWERAALIKARPVAGDIDLGSRLLANLAPFIWRKYFDYAAIADIHAMKRQIHAVRGHAAVAVAGHNVKLGRGGIREIEFFVQTQQLIFGGRRQSLRGARTLDMLVELGRDGWITEDAVADLSAAYRYLRMVEHRLQMIADEQTQRLPEDGEALKRFARFLGHDGVAAFERELTGHLRRVESHYARLFEHSPGLDARAGSLVFTGVVDDPDTVETLRAMDFVDPGRVIETIRGWHFGRHAAARGPRAREVLTELVPALLEAFSGCGDPDAALAAFDAAMARMPAAVELLSILKSNASVRELFADILGGAPRLADVITRAPHVLDAAIDPAVARVPVNVETFRARINGMADRASTTEMFLDGVRDIAREEQFLIGVRALSGVIDPARAGKAYSDLAEAIVGATLARVEKDFASEHGEAPGGRCAVLALGRLGSREMTATSDLDLMLIYEYDDAATREDGQSLSPPAQYYARLTQRFITALVAPTARGGLYEVDMRLRPSGNKGPLATRLSRFRDYQEREAESWEHMALTRARVVAGGSILKHEIEASISGVLRARRAIPRLKRDVREMRALVAKEKDEGDPWDLKIAPGGLMDIDFIAQHLILAHAADNGALINIDVGKVLLSAARGGYLDAEDAGMLIEARALFTEVTQMTRIVVEGRFDPARTPSGALRRIAAATRLPAFGTLDATLREGRGRVRAFFDQFLA